MQQEENARLHKVTCHSLYLHIILGQPEQQQHALLASSCALGGIGVKFLEQEVKLFLIEGLSQVHKHVEHVCLHSLKGVRLHNNFCCENGQCASV